MPSGPTADRVIARLGLEPHPEGGWFAETFRDNPDSGRGHSTAIYFLLKDGEQSAWHRVRDAAEVWHFYAGAPLSLEIAHPDGAGLRELFLGPDLEADQRPQQREQIWSRPRYPARLRQGFEASVAPYLSAI